MPKCRSPPFLISKYNFEIKKREKLRSLSIQLLSHKKVG